MQTMTAVYEQIIDFITAGKTEAQIESWQPSAEVKAKVWQLIEAEKQGSISPDDLAELNHYMELEHIIRMAKARAHARSGHE
jgi:hypothetical protein